MAASELQKRIVYILVIVVAISFLLMLLPAVENWITNFAVSEYGLIISDSGAVTMADGSTPNMMIQTSINLISHLVKIVKIILLMLLVVSIVRFIGFLITKTIYRTKSGKAGEASSLIRTVLSIVIYIVAFFIIFQSVFPTVALAPLFTGSTIIGIVVGLAVQDTLGNLFAGLALQADQPFQVGDVVSITNRGNGVVESISWRGVQIRTFQNKLLVISNSILGKEMIEVSPKENLNARVVFFNTLYSNSPARTIQSVREAVRQVENVSHKIRPVVRIRNLGADGIDWEVKYWLDDYRQHNDTDAMIRLRIWYVFQREKIEFAFPTRTIYMESKPEDAAPEEMLDLTAERLNQVSIFAPLSDDEIENLANASVSRVYAPGEAIVRRGQMGGSMFVIIRGSVKVQIPEKDYQKTINKLGENAFFGEMSLLTGEPRTATVIAEEETEVLQIRKEGLKPLLENNPELVQAISVLIEERKKVLDAQAEPEGDETSGVRKTVIRSIRDFFGLRGS